MTEIHPNIGERVFQNLIETFVLPEVQRRVQTGRIAKPFALGSLNMIQIIFYPDGRNPLVRLDEEVRGRLEAAKKPGVTKEKGDCVYASEIEGINRIQLIDEEMDYGHATFLRLDGKWVGYFSFIYYQGLARKCVSTAREFCEMARDSFEKKYWGPFIDSLFGASELAAKALLLSWGESEIAGQKSHTLIHSRLNMHRRIGNAAEQHVKTYNILSKVRYPARYLDAELNVNAQDAAEYLEHIEQMIKAAESWTNP
jgi:HEPN domain-containing protein